MTASLVFILLISTSVTFPFAVLMLLVG